MDESIGQKSIHRIKEEEKKSITTLVVIRVEATILCQYNKFEKNDKLLLSIKRLGL